MKIQDLGTVSGPVMLFGGPYSNLSASRALLHEARRRGVAPGNLLCTGDVVGYGASPLETLSEIAASGAVVIAGNVEKQLAVGAADCGCGFAPGAACAVLSDGWYSFAEGQMTGAWRDWMEALPDAAVFAHEGRRYAMIHGGLTDISRFLWPSSPEAAFQQEITAIEAACGPVDGVIAGHAGLAFERLINGVHWINAGVIGLPPHDGRRATRYATLDADGARFHRLSYDPGAAVSLMQAAGLTQGYERTLTTGIWPSEDVLPPALRRQEFMS